MKIGMVGSGMIAEECLKALQDVVEIQVTAICTRPGSKQRGMALAEEYKIASVYTDYDEMLRTGDFDFVYAGISNHLHYEYGRKALLAHRHVIIEKPFTVRKDEALKLVQLAERNSLFLLEAITTLHFPNFHMVSRLLPEVGRVRLVQCNFSQYSSRYDRYREGIVLPVFDPACAGGALVDLNVYNLHFTTALFGRPERLQYYPNRGFNGVDTSGVLMLVYPDFTAVLTAAKDSSSPGRAVIQGEEGTLQLTSAPNVCSGVELLLKGELRRYQKNIEEHYMATEFLAFHQMFVQNDLTECRKKMEQTLLVAELLEEAKRSAGLQVL